MIGIDTVPARRELGKRFGCDEVIDPGADPGTASEAEMVKRVKALAKPEGADAVIERRMFTSHSKTQLPMMVAAPAARVAELFSAWVRERIARAVA